MPLILTNIRFMVIFVNIYIDHGTFYVSFTLDFIIMYGVMGCIDLNKISRVQGCEALLFIVLGVNISHGYRFA